MFGDLDISVLDELPPGRTPVKTYAITGKKRADMYGFVRRQLAAGRQAYIVCPVIDEGENDMQAVTTYYTDVAQPAFGALPRGTDAWAAEGRGKGRRDGRLSRPVRWTCWCPPRSSRWAWTCPNANVIVIENAERYGLSAAAPAARARGTRQRRSVLCAHQRPCDRCGKKAALVFMPYERWLRNRKIRSGNTRAGRLFRQPAARPAHAAHRGPDGRQPCIVCRPRRRRWRSSERTRRCAAPETRGCDVWPRSCSPATRH